MKNNLRQLSLKHLSLAISLQLTDALVNQSVFECNNCKIEYLVSLDKPNHPNVSVIPAQKLSKRTLYFQSKWYEDYEWIHYDSDLKKVLCFYCSKASTMGVTDLAHSKDLAFITQGFNNWKKATENFKLHQSSHGHVFSVNQVAAMKRPSVIVQIHTEKQKEQAIARNCLINCLHRYDIYYDKVRNFVATKKVIEIIHSS